VSCSADWNVTLACLRDPACDALIIDPTIGGEGATPERLTALSAASGELPTPAILGYVSVTASAVKAAHSLARIGASEIVVRGVDDSVASLRRTLHRVVADHAAARLVIGSNLLAALPSAIAEAIVTLFRRPERVRSVPDLAASAGTTRRSLDRYLARAGLASARTLLGCARAHAAFQLLASRSVGPSGAAIRVGYPSLRALTREFRALTGHVPSGVPSRLTSDLFIATVSRRLMRSDGA
jgi:AraC-like DNA-binding protein